MLLQFGYGKTFVFRIPRKKILAMKDDVIRTIDMAIKKAAIALKHFFRISKYSKFDNTISAFRVATAEESANLALKHSLSSISEQCSIVSKMCSLTYDLPVQGMTELSHHNTLRPRSAPRKHDEALRPRSGRSTRPEQAKKIRPVSAHFDPLRTGNECFIREYMI